MSKRILLGMSGGVDSSAAALCLLEQGYDVSGVTALLTPEADESDEAVRDARRVCEVLGLQHFVVDLRQKFADTVIDNFAGEYKEGRTPNPCIVCNRTIKFGALLAHALANGFDAVATGHYAGIVRTEGGEYTVRCSKNGKDQSYVLWQLSQHQLAHALLPLCDMQKSDLREKVRMADLPVFAKSDSQDICFVPDGDYAAFLEKNFGIVGESGAFVDESGKRIGTHMGIHRYTVGQRKGLGGGFPEPMFVGQIIPSANEIVLCPQSGRYKSTVFCKGINMMLGRENGKPFDASVKLRYNAPAAPAQVICDSERGTAEIIFKQPQGSPTPGQSAVFYDENNCVIGGGIIVGAR